MTFTIMLKIHNYIGLFELTIKMVITKIMIVSNTKQENYIKVPKNLLSNGKYNVY